MTQTTEEQTAAAWGDYGSAGAWAPVLGMLAEVDSRIAAHLRSNDRVMAQLRSCEWYGEGYPHPGCAAFGPPDVFTCASVATHRAVYVDQTPYVDGYWEREHELPIGDEHPEIGITLSCAEHVHELCLDDQFAELLYVEEIETGERVDVEQLRSAETISA